VMYRLTAAGERLTAAVLATETDRV